MVPQLTKVYNIKYDEKSSQMLTSLSEKLSRYSVKLRKEETQIVQYLNKQPIYCYQATDGGIYKIEVCIT